MTGFVPMPEPPEPDSDPPRGPPVCGECGEPEVCAAWCGAMVGPADGLFGVPADNESGWRS